MINLNGKQKGYIAYNLKQDLNGQVFYCGFKIADVSEIPVKIFVKEIQSHFSEKQTENLIELLPENTPVEFITVPNPKRKNKSVQTHKQITILSRGRAEIIRLSIPRHNEIKQKYGSIKKAIEQL